MNWMIAGRGITHSERFERARREGGPLHAIQSWVALPQSDEEAEPAFAHHEGTDLPVHRDGGVWLRVLAGDAFGLSAASRRTRRSSTCTSHSNPARASRSLTSTPNGRRTSSPALSRPTGRCSAPGKWRYSVAVLRQWCRRGCRAC
jgi:redox-sensitive bicupin YhaK (pirin superfamily)